ncbi:hypothetical protein ACSEE7_20865, partial [Halomonas cupida]|uniref:hypothetical protein n=1 Tax=Halomonas cupida TaxID=44933 RepID=UPI003EF80590
SSLNVPPGGHGTYLARPLEARLNDEIDGTFAMIDGIGLDDARLIGKDVITPVDQSTTGGGDVKRRLHPRHFGNGLSRHLHSMIKRYSHNVSGMSPIKMRCTTA